MGASIRLSIVLVVCGALVSGVASAANIGVVPKKLIVVDKLAKATKAKLVYVSKDKDAGITKGTSTDVGQISVQFNVAYGNGSAAGAFTLTAGASNGTSGWLVNKETVAKYVNKDAPSGPTEAKVAVIKPDKLLKLVGKGLGDTPFDIMGGGDPNPGTVSTAYCVTNDGETNCHCSTFTGCAYKLIAGDTGAKLVCKTGTADGGCAAAPPPPTTTTTSTSSTTTTSTSSTTTTVPCPTCLDWVADACNVDVCGGGCDESPGCAQAQFLDGCFGVFASGTDCCALGGSCIALAASCPTEATECGIDIP